MSKSADLIHPPPPTMRDKVGPRGAGFDAEAIARAEGALAGLADNFQTWMSADVERLDAARTALRAADFGAAEAGEVFYRSHDIKGLGTTYDYPLATAIAAALCRLLETPEARATARSKASLIDAHVDAIRAIVRDGVRDTQDPTGKAIAQTLRAHVDAMMGPE